MVEEAEADEARCSTKLVCCSNILGSRSGVARWMVMRDCERSAVMAKHRVEDLSHWQEGAVDAALAYPNDSPELIRRVTDEDDCSFTRGVSDLANCHCGDVGGGPQGRWGRVVCSESGQPEARDESRRLVEIDARNSHERLRLSPREPRDASELPGEASRRLQAALPRATLLKDECDELLGAECVDAVVGQPVSRGIEGFSGLQREKSCMPRLLRSATSVRQLRAVPSRGRARTRPWRSRPAEDDPHRRRPPLASALGRRDTVTVEPAGDFGEAVTARVLPSDASGDVCWKR